MLSPSPPRDLLSPRAFDMRRGNVTVSGPVSVPVTNNPLSAGGSRGPVSGGGLGLGASAFPSAAPVAPAQGSSLTPAPFVPAALGDGKIGRPKVGKANNDARNIIQLNPGDELESGKGPPPSQLSTTPPVAPAAASASGKEESKQGGQPPAFVFSQPTQFPSRN